MPKKKRKPAVPRKLARLDDDRRPGLPSRQSLQGGRQDDPPGFDPVEHLGCDLKETTKGTGRKVRRIDKPLEMPKTARQEYRSIAELPDALIERVEEIDDKGFRIEPQAFQLRMLTKLKPR